MKTGKTAYIEFTSFFGFIGGSIILGLFGLWIASHWYPKDDGLNMPITMSYVELKDMQEQIHTYASHNARILQKYCKLVPKDKDCDSITDREIKSGVTIQGPLIIQ